MGERAFQRRSAGIVLRNAAALLTREPRLLGERWLPRVSAPRVGWLPAPATGEAPGQVGCGNAQGDVAAPGEISLSSSSSAFAFFS